MYNKGTPTKSVGFTNYKSSLIFWISPEKYVTLPPANNTTYTYYLYKTCGNGKKLNEESLSVKFPSFFKATAAKIDVKF